MPALGVNFDASRVAPAEPGASVWEGVVPMRIDRSEIVETANKSGKMLVFHVTAMAGEYIGQNNVIRLNIWNTNPQAMDIAQRQLSSICHCTGRMQVQDSDQLNGGMLLGIWAKEMRSVQDQQTGMAKEIPTCQCKDFRLPDGRTIKEAMGGQPASMPYTPGAPAPSPQQAVQPPAGGAPGFTPGPAPAPQSAPPTGTGGFAPAGGFAPPGQAGAAPAPAAPGFSTAGSPSNAPGAAPGGFGGGGFGGPAAPAAPGGGFAPQAAPAGFPQPGAPQPGPWGQNG